MITQKFSVKGMHCASCSALIMKHLKKLDGIADADVNVATEQAKVTFESDRITQEKMNQVLEPLGYSLIVEAEVGERPPVQEQEDPLVSERSKTYFVLPLAVTFFVLMLWEIAVRKYSFVPNFPFPMEFWNIFSFVVATMVLFWIGKPFLSGLLRFMRFGTADMHALIGIGTSVAYLHSSLIVLSPSFQTYFRFPEETYFDVVIVVIGFVTFGKYLEARAKAKTGDAIARLLHLQAKTALVVRGDEEIEVSIKSVMPDDLVRVKPAGRIPVDGVIVDGGAFIDESMLSGESMPVEKKVDDLVQAGTLNMTGTFVFRVTAIGQSTLLARIIRMVEEAQGSRAPIQAMADRISAVFVPVVLGLSGVAFLGWLILGTPVYGFSQALSFALLAFVGILVIACPCALGLATPTAIIVGVGKGAEKGILVRDAATLEGLSRAQVIVMDKTGTLTKGEPELVSIHPSSGYEEQEIIALANAIENRSEHPLAKAFVKSSLERNVAVPSVSDFQAEQGKGVRGVIDGRAYFLGSSRWAEEKGISVDKVLMDQDVNMGKITLVLFSEQEILGTFFVADAVKPEAHQAVVELQKLGVRVIMLTGDRKQVASSIGKQVGIQEIIAEVSPDDKFAAIKRLQEEGNIVAMVGDGINDAPALAQANIGIAMATGTDAAIESSGITLLHGDIGKLVQAIRLSRMTLVGIKQNLFFAFVFNVIGIPLAGGLFYPVFGWLLSPAFAGLAMAFSSVTVVGNALRLRGKKL
ncbi:MAG: heavy metal translocating P-type ATPase [Candidatus Moranbacteria bacterium]|nr:heavy metal translocating P-type ATPase [Candidatus Moranbacteria bacterium]